MDLTWPVLTSFGITRVGDLTDLDVLGIPVWFCTRPNSRSLAVSQGKGLSHQQARVSAVMEAFEGAAAEQTRRLVAEFGSPAEMAARDRDVVSLQHLVRCRFEFFDQRQARAWVRGVSYGTGRTVYAPYELVGLDMRDEFPWDRRAFHMSSDGLAAGPNFAFAALAALLELVERDATLLSDTFGHLNGLSRPLHWMPGLHEGLDEAVMKIKAAGLQPRFFDRTGKCGIPVISAMITRPVLEENGSGERLSGGDACRLDPSDAALAALLEAVQSRLTNVAGSRDDLEESHYKVLATAIPPVERHTPTLADLSARYPEPARLSDSEKLHLVASRLREAGYSDVYLFEIPHHADGIHVVRALVPGLRGVVEGDVSNISLEDIIGGL